MAHTYSVHTFSEAGVVAAGGVTAAYQAAAETLAKLVPADQRLVQLTELERFTELDTIKVSFLALTESA